MDSLFSGQPLGDLPATQRIDEALIQGSDSPETARDAMLGMPGGDPIWTAS